MGQEIDDEAKRPYASVRFAANDLADLQFIGLCLNGLYFKRMLGTIALEVISMVKENDFRLSDRRILASIKANPNARAAAKRVRSRGIRKLPNSSTVPTWIPFEPMERAVISEVSAKTRWSAAQVVMEAIQTGLELASAETALVTVPPFIEVYRPLTLSDEADRVRNEINFGLGFKRVMSAHTKALELPPRQRSASHEIIERGVGHWLKMLGATKTEQSMDTDTGVDVLATFPAGPVGHVTCGVLILTAWSSSDLSLIEKILGSLRERTFTQLWVVSIGDIPSALAASLRVMREDNPRCLVLINGSDLLRIIMGWSQNDLPSLPSRFSPDKNLVTVFNERFLDLP